MAPPVPLDQVLSYRTQLRDAVTGRAPTDASSLVTLYRPRTDSHLDRLLVNLALQCRPGKICSLITENGDVFPPGPEARREYRVSVTFAALMQAPVVRLICDWDAGVRASPYTKERLEHIALDFHFNNIEGMEGIEQLGIVHGDGLYDELCFTSHGCTAQGLTLALHNEYIGHHGKAFVSHLHRLLNSTTVIRLRFDTPFDDGASALPDVWPYIVGNGVEKLRSLTMPEWSAMPLQSERNMLDLLNAPAPFPWVRHECSDTFSTIKEASVALYESARLTSLEADEIVRDWASVGHLGILHQIGGAVVLAVRNSSVPPNSPIRTLGDSSYSQLPDKLSVLFTLVQTSGEQITEARADRCAIPIRLPSHHDMLFVVGSVTDSIRAACVAPSDVNSGSWCEVHFQHRNSPQTLQRQLETAVNLAQSHSWHPIILNQRHDLPAVDLAGTSPLAKDEVDEAFQQVLQMATWNPEQCKALHSVREAVGRCVLVSGPAGTGKTLVIQAICLFLHTIGLHVLVLAPANSNCTDFIRRFTSSFKEITATRVFPPSADYDYEKIASGVRDLEQPDKQTPGDLGDFEMVRALLQSNTDKNALYEDFGLPAQVLNAAREEKFTLIKSFQEESFDVWQVLKQNIEANDSGDFGQRKDLYQFCYDECKAHYMAVATRLVVTTTGNVRCSVIRENFAKVDCHGLVVIVDEACKDREIDTLSAMVLPEWRDKIGGIIMLGDEKQLQPTNTSAQGRISFNPFHGRTSIPLFSRLQRQGFPTITHLVEQHRMASNISKFAHDNFYPFGTMRDAAEMNKSLRDKMPGLHGCLKDILTSIPRTKDSAVVDFDDDLAVRVHYLEVKGFRDKSKRSPVVREHVRTFFDKVYWHLRAYFMQSVEAEVMVICAYKEARHCWLETLDHYQKKFKIPNTQLPRVLTIDSSQGAEATVTIVDCSVQNYHPSSVYRDIGFVDDDKRMNVALTRAREVRWCIGGSCNPEGHNAGAPYRPAHALHDPHARPPAYVRYKQELASKGAVSIIKNRILRRDMAWLDYLRDRRGEIHVERTFAQDMEDIARG